MHKRSVFAKEVLISKQIIKSYRISHDKNIVFWYIEKRIS